MVVSDLGLIFYGKAQSRKWLTLCLLVLYDCGESSEGSTEAMPIPDRDASEVRWGVTKKD